MVRTQKRWGWIASGFVAASILLSGCSGGGSKGGSSAAPTSTVVQAPSLVSAPSGTQAGAISISYKLFASSFTQVSIRAEYSIDGGAFQSASAADGGDGTSQLAATPYGSAHVFVWDSVADVGKRSVTAQFRIVAEGSSTPAVTAPFTIDNPGDPKVTSFTPATGENTAGIVVAIQGLNLRSIKNVTLVDLSTANVVTLENLVSTSDTLLYATVPAGTQAASYSLRVQTSTGTATASGFFQLYEPKPTVTAVTPSTSTGTQAMSVKITGTQFGSASKAYIENVDSRVRVDLTNFQRRTATEIVATVPAALGSGFYDVFVVNRSQAGHNDAGPQYIVTRIPIATGISPSSGVNTATTNVTISGSNLAGVTAGHLQPRTLGSVGTLTSIRVSSNLSLGAVVPSGLKPGYYDVILSNASGTGTQAGAAFLVTEAQPLVTAVTPASILNTAVRRVTISGENLAGTKRIILQLQSGTLTVYVTPAFVTDAATVVADIPAYLVPGNWDLTVENSVGSSPTPVYLTVTEAEPTLTVLSPATGINNLTTSVTATGSNLLGSFTVTMAGPKPLTTVALALTPTVNPSDHTHIGFTVDANLRPGDYDVKVTNTVGTSNAVVFKATEPVPTITDLFPASVSNSADQTVTIVGTSLWGAYRVSLSGPQSKTIVPGAAISNTQLPVVVPAAMKPGKYNVTVTNTAGTSTGGPQLEITEPLPELDTVTPVSALNTTTAAIIITGRNLLGAYQVNALGPETFNVSPVNVVSPTQVSAVLPAWKRPGSYNLRVTNTAGMSLSSVAFTVLEAVPTITQISPVSGLDTRSTVVTVDGENLLGTQSVLLSKIGSTYSTSLTDFTVDSHARIRVTVVPELPPGLYRFQVRNTVGLSNALTYAVTERRPSLTALFPPSGPAMTDNPVVGQGNDLLGVFQLTLHPVNTNSVLFSRQTTRNFVVTGPNTLYTFPATVSAPIVPGTYRATCVNTAARSDISTAPTYIVTESLPVLTLTTPGKMPFDVTTIVELRGSNLYGTTCVTLTSVSPGVPATCRVFPPLNVYSDTRIDFRAVAPIVASTYTITVANTAGQSNGVSFTVTDSGFKDRQFSSSLALTPDGRTLVVANISVPRVTTMRVGSGTLTKIGETTVGREPTCVTVDPYGNRAYVTNRLDGTVSVLDATSSTTWTRLVDIPVGNEPVGLALTPSGRWLYVANSTSDSISVVDTQSNTVTQTILLPATDRFPFAVACSNDGDSLDTDEKVYVTQYFGQLPSGSRPPVNYGDSDTGRVGKVTVISVATNTITKTVQLQPHLTGFTANRTAFGGSATTATSAWPNLLASVVIRGDRAYVTSGGASPEGPLRYDTSQQAFLWVIDTTTDTELTSSTISLNAAANGETPPGYYFNTPWCFALAPGRQTGYVACGGSDILVKVDLNVNGDPSITGTATPASSAGIVRVPVDKNPRSVIFDIAGTQAFVHNYISRDVSIVNPFSHTELTRVSSVSLPTAGSLAANILRGEELFSTSRGTSSIDGSIDRMSERGFASCFGCHPFAWSDTAVWATDSGPRKTPSLNAVFARTDPTDQSLPTRSAIFDEIADFELFIREVMSAVDPLADSPPHGLIVGPGAPTTSVRPLLPNPNTGRSVDWTRIEQYLQYGVRSPVSPMRGTDMSAGRAVFVEAGCTECHAGAKWTASTRMFTPPPTAGVTITSTTPGGEIQYALRVVDTFLAAERTSQNTTARGANGFDPPSLLGFWAFPPYFHHGQAQSCTDVLDLVFNTVPHKNISVPGVLDNSTKRTLLMGFLKSIDDSTQPFKAFSESQYSSSLALTPDGQRLFVANGCGTSVTVMRVVTGGLLTKETEITVGSEPTSITVNPEGTKAFVTNRGSGTVSVIDVATLTKKATDITVEAEPIGCALTPTGRRLFVANGMSNSVSIIDTEAEAVLSTIAIPSSSTGRAFPFAVAITNSGDMNDSDEKVYVTQYFGQFPTGSRPSVFEGDTDTGRVGRVTVFSVGTSSIIKNIDLAPQLTGFTSDRTNFGGSATTSTYAWPNLLASIFIRSNRAYVTSSAVSPQGPVRYDTNNHAFVSVIDTGTDVEVTASTVNLNQSALGEVPQGHFFNTPWGFAIAPGGTSGYVLSAASDVAVRVTLSTDGTPIVTGAWSPLSSKGIVRVDVGKNPRSVVFNRTGTKAYVHNYIGRTVSVIDAATDTVTGTTQSIAQPTAGSLAASTLRGEELFNTSRGTSAMDGSTDRMSESGIGSCFACHPFGWSDTVVWGFRNGPRKTPPLIGDFSRTEPGNQRVFNWSANRDEVADMEDMIRYVSATVPTTITNPQHGLIVNVASTDIMPLVPKANNGRSSDWTDIENYIRYGIRSPISPLRGTAQTQGRAAFAAAGCTMCHSGTKWTLSRRTWTPPPTLAPTGSVSVTAQGEVYDTLKRVDTYLTTERNDLNAVGIGYNGFNPPSLNGFWAFPPFFHNGQALTPEEVMDRILNTMPHRNAGVSGVLDDATVKANLIQFLRSIDDNTAPF